MTQPEQKQEYTNNQVRERVILIEDPSSEESILPKLPVKDAVIAIVGMIVLCAGVFVWGYGH